MPNPVGSFHLAVCVPISEVVVASGLIAYLGVFTPDYRSGAVEQWTRQTKEFELPGSEVRGCRR